MSFAPLPGLQVTWNDVTLAGGDSFQAWNVKRRLSGTTAWTRIATLGNRATRAYTDYTPASGQSYDYAVSVTVNRGGTLLESPVGTITASITFSSAFLHDVRNPSNYAELKDVDTQLVPQQFQTLLQPWGGQAPVLYVGQAQPHVVTVQGVAVEFADYSSWPVYETLYTNQRVAGAVYCYRNFWAGDRLFVGITAMSRHDSLGYWEPNFVLTEVKFAEGV